MQNHAITSAMRPLTRAERFAQLRELHATLRRTLDRAERAGAQVPQDLRARVAACEADMMEAQFDNVPI